MILLINPWIHDFSAYDMWMMPLGLLHLGSKLKNLGYEVKLINLINAEHPERINIKRKPTGDGKIPYEVIDKPEALKNIPKKYKRYGIPVSAFMEELKNLPSKVDVILVTSKMTYWYPGVQETIRIVKRVFSETKVVLGGTYVKLLPEHARRFSGADIIISEESEENLVRLSSATGIKLTTQHIQPAHDYYEMDLSLLPRVYFLPLLSSIGCPFNCTYCSSRKLFSSYRVFSAERVVDQILLWYERYNVNDITIFDDAFLVSRTHAKRIFTLLINSNKKFRIHAPNALHARYIDMEMAELMKMSGFFTIRIGLESSNPSFQEISGGKIFNNEFLSAVKNLHAVGYRSNDIGAYVMAGLPFQRKDEVIDTINFVIDAGARPKLVEYSPVPGTPLFETAKRCSPYDLDEPLFHNNSLLPCQWDRFTLDDFMEIKENLQIKIKSMI